jgi:hypothetical protein
MADRSTGMAPSRVSTRPVSETRRGSSRQLVETDGDPFPERRAALAGEARRWLRSHVRAEIVARRYASGGRAIRKDDAEAQAVRAEGRAVRMRLRFHSALDRLVVAGGFAEATTILQERRRKFARLSAEDRVSDSPAPRGSSP